MLEKGLSEPRSMILAQRIPASANLIAESVGLAEGERFTSLVHDRGIPWNVNPLLGGKGRHCKAD